MVHSDNTSPELVVTIIVISWTNILTMMPIMRKIMAKTIMAIKYDINDGNDDHPWDDLAFLDFS